MYGSGEQVAWSVWSWEAFVDGELHCGTHDYGEEDLRGQAAMTEAMFDWLEDDNAPHPLRLERALTPFNLILGTYSSALQHKPVTLPVQPETSLIEKLRRRMIKEAKS